MRPMLALANGPRARNGRERGTRTHSSSHLQPNRKIDRSSPIPLRRTGLPSRTSNPLHRAFFTHPIDQSRRPPAIDKHAARGGGASATPSAGRGVRTPAAAYSRGASACERAWAGSRCVDAIGFG